VKLILIEGVPGSGKSTTAEKVTSHLLEQGMDATWYLEESESNPLRSAGIKQLQRPQEFIENCLKNWRSFVERTNDQHQVQVLEGAAFQLTVRFMFEHNLPGIKSYFASFQEIVASLDPRFIYLRPADLHRHSEFTAEQRGKKWAEKVSDYLEGTPYAKKHSLRGLTGMHRFWASYGAECDSLVKTISMPHVTVGVKEAAWDSELLVVREFLGL
jgi:hypothetical protein